MSVPIQGALIVAAMVPPRSKAPFNRAELIVSHEGNLVVARTYTSEGQAEGPGLNVEDKQSLIDSGQVVELSPVVPLTSGAALWVLRRNLPRRDRALSDLRGGGYLLHAPQPGENDAWLCVVDQAKASILLDRWKDEFVSAAKSHARSGDWPRAESEAGVAHTMSRGLDPEVLALLSLTHEHCGRERRARGLVEMARRSRGEEFTTEMTNAIERLRETLIVANPGRVRPHADFRSALSNGFPGQAQYLDKPKSARLLFAEPPHAA